MSQWRKTICDMLQLYKGINDMSQLGKSTSDKLHLYKGISDLSIWI